MKIFPLDATKQNFSVYFSACGVAETQSGWTKLECRSLLSVLVRESAERLEERTKVGAKLDVAITLPVYSGAGGWLP